MLKDSKVLCPYCGRDFCSDYMDIYSGLCLECTSKLLKEINQNFEEEAEIQKRLKIQSLEAEQNDTCENFEDIDVDEDDYEEKTSDDWNDDDYDPEEGDDDEDEHDYGYGYGYDTRDESMKEEDENYQNEEYDHYDEEAGDSAHEDSE